MFPTQSKRPRRTTQTTHNSKKGIVVVLVPKQPVKWLENLKKLTEGNGNGNLRVPGIKTYSKKWIN